MGAKGVSGPIVRFMQQKIKDLGGDLHKGNIRCFKCDEAQGGGLDPNYGIMLCANRPESLEDTLTHGKGCFYGNFNGRLRLAQRWSTPTTTFGSKSTLRRTT